MLQGDVRDQSRIREWLVRNERTQAWLARKADMSETQLHHLITCKHKAGPKTLRRLEVAMSLEIGSMQPWVDTSDLGNGGRAK